jgi:serine/threonine protein kinase
LRWRAPKFGIIAESVTPPLCVRFTLQKQLLLFQTRHNSSKMDVSEHDYQAAHDAAPTETADEAPQTTKGGRKALRAANKVNHQMTKHSLISSTEAELYIPRFHPSELVLGELLGIGGFNYVYAIERIALQKENEENSNSQHATDMVASQPQQDLRHNIAHSTEAFAVKFLNKKSLLDDDRYCIGSADLVLEAKLLASLNHEHIIKLRGLPANGTSGVGLQQELSYFLMLDRLPTTLVEKMQDWRMENDAIDNPTGGAVRKLWAMANVPLQKKKRLQQQMCRLQVALDIATALEYLHSKRIIYRDLKIENIGFTTNYTLKLFDFGLAKVLQPGDYQETYHLTGHTGSLRYMSPEVARYLPYNLSADVYSFGILLWQLYSMSMPFETMSRSAHSQFVVYGGERPPLDPAWPESLQEIMTTCWQEVPYQRPTMKDVCYLLQQELNTLEEATGKCSPRPSVARRERSGSFVLNRDAIAEQPPEQAQQKSSQGKKTFVHKVFQRLPSNVASSRAIVA